MYEPCAIKRLEICILNEMYSTSREGGETINAPVYESRTRLRPTRVREDTSATLKKRVVWFTNNNNDQFEQFLP